MRDHRQHDRRAAGADEVPANGNDGKTKWENFMAERTYPAGFWATHIEHPVTGIITNIDGSVYEPAAEPTREQIIRVIDEAVIYDSTLDAEVISPEKAADAILALLKR